MLYDEQKFKEFDVLHHFHLLLILFDYLMTDGNPDIKPMEDTQFSHYFITNYDASTRKALLKTYYNIRQTLFSFYAKHTDPNDTEKDDMDFILRM